MRNAPLERPTPQPERTMNLPNKLTVGRLLLTLVFLVVIFSAIPYRNTWALLLFVSASLTDYWDGKIARRDKLITNFGILMDPLADKILTCSAFIAFVEHELIPAWMVVVIVARELGITGLRLLAASKHVVLAAEGYGKHKTISQIVAIISVLVMVSYREWGVWADYIFGFSIWQRPWVETFTVAAQWVAVSLTFLSGTIYLWRNREIYLQDL
jgi:CDP-diacylglycerol--glycerol-3-phosphate 3-phosphatidyltransferase